MQVCISNLLRGKPNIKIGRYNIKRRLNPDYQNGLGLKIIHYDNKIFVASAGVPAVKVKPAERISSVEPCP